MTGPKDNVAKMLREFKGGDDESPVTIEALAAAIDAEYEAYIASLPGKTATIKAGQEATERRAA